MQWMPFFGTHIFSSEIQRIHFSGLLFLSRCSCCHCRCCCCCLWIFFMLYFVHIVATSYFLFHFQFNFLLFYFSNILFAYLDSSASQQLLNFANVYVFRCSIPLGHCILRFFFYGAKLCSLHSPRFVSLSSYLSLVSPVFLYSLL